MSVNNVRWYKTELNENFQKGFKSQYA